MPTRADEEPVAQIIGIDHVQLAMPPGGETVARGFYAGVLDLLEASKPAALVGRGGCWFASSDGAVAVHLGVEDDFRPARKAHPAFAVADLDILRRRLSEAGAEIVEDDSIGVRRLYTADSFGSRIELVAAGDAGFTQRDALAADAAAGDPS